MNKADNLTFNCASHPGSQILGLFGAILLLVVCTFVAPPKAFGQSQLQSGQIGLENTSESQETQSWSSFLPIWGEEARKRGYALPLPFGISANFYYEKQDFEVKDLNIAFGDGPFIPVGDFIRLEDIDTRQSNINQRWIFLKSCLLKIKN